ncbi:hypothetical protein HHI36_010235 [Cryptolaemus montrouzieri]|uniref:Uncharacterized protein n=1 Tax=Cryptolaemus montrouzieri TaxID=559131 RepID=A0ABD2MI74_9CUCU
MDLIDREWQKVKKKRGRKVKNAIIGAMKASERFVPETKAEDLENMLKGKDEIPVKILEAFANEIAGLLTPIVNLMLVTGKFPSALKWAMVRAIHKKGPKGQ